MSELLSALLLHAAHPSLLAPRHAQSAEERRAEEELVGAVWDLEYARARAAKLAAVLADLPDHLPVAPNDVHVSPLFSPSHTSTLPLCGVCVCGVELSE
eukprot:16149-Rhodomonas_salina.1